ncbi:hypothetical protein SISNIDRAFT_491922 [Sistotremastrum niveocremeum HHB9708]|uniref:Uncharacterized protein n=1 Tax=Sistotremastrum niveocremeum HHB9708 TaxID=1314777 RepID=A0A164M908_9AGAM|nr:hypothetical protein SISNIDRAFT_491922 [Sistotremastrum niveocremeum HHB9708]
MEPPHHIPRFTSELASVKKIMKCVFDARDSCLLGLHRNLYSIVFLDLKRRLGVVLDLRFGPLNMVEGSTIAHFHHTLPLLILEYRNNNEGDAHAHGPQHYVSLLDIPTSTPSSSVTSQEFGEITWIEPVTITHWTRRSDWPVNESEIPVTYDCMRTLTSWNVERSLSKHNCDTGMLCRKPNQELIIVKLRTFTSVYGPEASDCVKWQFPGHSSPQDQSWILAARFASEDIVEVVFLSADKRKTVDLRLTVPGYGKERDEDKANVRWFDPIYGQLFVQTADGSVMVQY